MLSRFTKIEIALGCEKNIGYINIAKKIFALYAADNCGRGALVPARVTRIFRNITKEWLVLSSGLTVTPGHRFLNEHGTFEAIEALVARGGSIVTAEGELIAVTAERVVYSEATRHLYEEAEEIRYDSVGGLALAPRIERGWRTYNFEVEGLHTYIAGGIRVHNDSIEDFNDLAGLVTNGCDSTLCGL